MIRWENIKEQSVLDMKCKMYREPFKPEDVQTIKNTNIEFDHLAHSFLGSELMMYRILDVNWIEYMEERGAISRMSKIFIPKGDNSF